ncbi:type II toxin-antitoxin system HicB family antitoxin [Methanocaldococcus sp. 28A]
MKTIKFRVYYDGKYWVAEGIDVSIFTQGETLDKLMKNIKEAVELHFEDELKAGEVIKILSVSEMEVREFA